MSRKVKFEWNYTPKDFLESNYSIDYGESEIQFESGNITLETDESILQQKPYFLTEAEKSINKFLQGISIQSHTTFKLSRKPTQYLKPDGSVDLQVATLEVASVVSIGSKVDVRVTDKDGNVIRDSKIERIEEKQSWGQLVSSVNEENKKLVDIYTNAINDKKNELIHLYEIRDFVTQKLDGAKKARSILSVSKKDWDLLGDIANNRPIFEGRHRGKHVEQLRRATREELNSARKIAKKILWNYLKYSQRIAT